MNNLTEIIKEKKIKSIKAGKIISDTEVTNISQHGFSWSLAKGSSFRYLEHDPEILSGDYRKGMGFWGGAYNTHFSIHPKFGYGIVAFHQFVPYGDEDVFRLYFMFEQEVHKAIIQEKI